MKITRKTRGLAKYLTLVANNQTFYLGVIVDQSTTPLLKELGFSIPPISGEKVLPSAEFGKAAEKNANGHIIVHRDRPMETAYRQREWSWKEFHGRYDYEEKSKIVEVPYQRYPRTEVPPYAVCIEALQNEAGNILLVCGPFVKQDSEYERATNTANMLIEIFGVCVVFNKDLFAWKKAPLRQLNWELLPPGKNPWATGKPALDRIIEKTEPGNRPVIQARFDAVGKYDPEFLAVGKAGFDGYIIFGFPSRGFCILESRQVNNATYVLNDDSWEHISSLSKAEILSANAHKARLVHREGWFSALAALMRKKAA